MAQRTTLVAGAPEGRLRGAPPPQVKRFQENMKGYCAPDVTFFFAVSTQAPHQPFAVWSIVTWYPLEIKLLAQRRTAILSAE